MDTGTKWEHYNAGQHARVSSMAGITYFVALPSMLLTAALLLVNPSRPSAAMQSDANLTAHNALGDGI